ncbi:FkbM family methyltransferase [Nitrobacteraceae bacterium AZCC 2161]
MIQRVARYLNSYGAGRTTAAVLAYARRHVYAAALPVAVSVGLPTASLAQAIWSDQSPDADATAVFRTMQDRLTSLRAEPIVVGVPAALKPVFAYLSGLLNPGSRVASYEELAATSDCPALVYIDRLSMAPLVGWFDRVGDCYGMVGQAGEFALLARGDGDTQLVQGLRAAFELFGRSSHPSHGVDFRVRAGTTDAVLIDETWTVYIEALAAKGIVRADTVLDLGAHIGGFALHAAKHLGCRRIVAIEAMPDNFGLLADNIAGNGFAQILHPIHGAVLDRDGEAILSAPGTHTGVARVEANATASTVTVPALDARRIVAEIGKIDLLKIDIEGAEIAVFRRLGSLLQTVDVIIGELHTTPFGTPNDALAMLAEHGFAVELTGDRSTPAFVARRIA